jgi:hypothetical protein
VAVTALGATAKKLNAAHTPPDVGSDPPLTTPAPPTTATLDDWEAAWTVWAPTINNSASKKPVYTFHFAGLRMILLLFDHRLDSPRNLALCRTRP